MITFSTPNGRSLSYLPTHGILMLQMLGAIPANQVSNQASAKAAGVIPQEAVAAALTTLKQQTSLLAAELDAQTQQNSDSDAKNADQGSNNQADNNEQEQTEYEPTVASRVYPLLKLLEAAIQEQQPVVWQDSSKV